MNEMVIVTANECRVGEITVLAANPVYRCNEEMGGLICTRSDGHRGQHVAAIIGRDTGEVLACWFNHKDRMERLQKGK
jgi:hypothetical protein